MVLMSYPGVTARSEGDFDAQPEIGGVESGFSDHVQVRFIIQRECQRNRSDFVFESDDPVDPEREFAFVMVPRPDVDAGAVIEVESAGDYRHVPFVEGVPLNPCAKSSIPSIELTGSKLCRTVMPEAVTPPRTPIAQL